MRGKRQIALFEATMHRAGTPPGSQRYAEIDEVHVPLTDQQVLLSSGGEQHVLREEILELSRENEQERSRALFRAGAFAAEREDIRGIMPRSAYDVEGRDINIAMHQRARPRDVGHRPDREEVEIHGDDRTAFEALPSRPSGNTVSRVDINAADIRRVDLIGRSVTSMSLGNSVEAIVGEPTTIINGEAPLLWSLVIRQCQLFSLLPVAGLLHHLDNLTGLRVHEVAGLALAGVERVLADARCLSTLTISNCGLTHLPRLQSGSIEVLDLSDNKLDSASGLEMLFRLKELNLAGNNLSTLTDLRPLISLGAGCLRELNLDRNPIRKLPRYERGNGYCVLFHEFTGLQAHPPYFLFSACSTIRRGHTNYTDGAYYQGYSKRRAGSLGHIGHNITLGASYTQVSATSLRV